MRTANLCFTEAESRNLGADIIVIFMPLLPCLTVKVKLQNNDA